MARKKKDLPEVANRKAEIFQDLIDGKARATIIRESILKWGITRASVVSYIQDVNKQMVETYKNDMSVEMAKAINRFEKIIEIGFKDLRFLHHALAATKEIVELLGLKKIQVDVNHSLTFVTKIGPDGAIQSGFTKEGEGSPLPEITDFIDVEGEDTSDIMDKL